MCGPSPRRAPPRSLPGTAEALDVALDKAQLTGQSRRALATAVRASEGTWLAGLLQLPSLGEKSRADACCTCMQCDCCETASALLSKSTGPPLRRVPQGSGITCHVQTRVSLLHI